MQKQDQNEHSDLHLVTRCQNINDFQQQEVHLDVKMNLVLCSGSGGLSPNIHLTQNRGVSAKTFLHLVLVTVGFRILGQGSSVVVKVK